ncbi:MAG: hypothetical protein H6581_25360 [Bacteroidia bacterium]|nr:hypothetical protein [Bacteroidia bacterium]
MMKKLFYSLLSIVAFLALGFIAPENSTKSTSIHQVVEQSNQSLLAQANASETGGLNLINILEGT